MRLFRYRIIKEEEYQNLKRSELRVRTLSRIKDWFSGWSDLNVIWEYVFNEKDYWGGIERCRENYAKARGTTIYNEHLREE